MRRLIAVLLLAGVAAVPAFSAQTKTHKRPPRSAAAEQQTPLTDQEAGDQLRKRLQDILNAWSVLDPDAAAKYYAKDADLVFFEPNALQYKGWDAYYLGMKKLFANYQNMNIRLNDDASVHFKGDLAYATATWNVEGTKSDNSKEQMELRWTVILERRNGEWVVVHEHVSAPLTSAAAPASKPEAPKQPEKPKDPFK
jgi:ketosteroid isomerase-like protein